MGQPMWAAIRKNIYSFTLSVKGKVKVAHTQLPSVGFRSWSQSLAVSLQVTWVINPAVGYHYFPPGLQLHPQSSRGLLPILLLGEQRHNGFEQFAYDCYPTASRLRFEPGPFCAWVQHANHSATEPSYSVCMLLKTSFSSTGSKRLYYCYHLLNKAERFSFPWRDLGPHLIHSSLVPPESICQTTPRSVQPLLPGSRLWRADTHTYISQNTSNYRLHLLFCTAK